MTLKQVAENHGLTPDGVDYALRQYQIVISEITHGMLSKLSYDAHDIIRYAQERWCDTCELKESNGWERIMDKREKVIKGLECCSQMAGEMCRNCPYANECEEGEGLLAGAAHLAGDALELLKSGPMDTEGENE